MHENVSDNLEANQSMVGIQVQFWKGGCCLQQVTLALEGGMSTTAVPADRDPGFVLHWTYTFPREQALKPYAGKNVDQEKLRGSDVDGV